MHGRRAPAGFAAHGWVAEQKGSAAGQRRTKGAGLVERQSGLAVGHGQRRLAAVARGRICLVRAL